LEESEAPTTEPAWDGSVQILAWSADTPGALATAIRESLQALSQEKDPKRFAYNARQIRQAFDHDQSCRGLLIFSIADNWQAEGAALCQHIENGHDQPLIGRNAFYGTGQVSGELCLLFPGQGSQYLMMGRDLACIFPEVREAMEGIGEAGRAVYPIPAANPAERDRQAALLAHTDITQPALAGLELGMLRVLRRFGVAFDAAAGHSFGELTALCAGGVISEETLIRLARERGRLMAGSGGDRGTMLAVQAPLGEIQRLVDEIGGGLVLANRNSPTQGVISGPRDLVAKAESLCAERGWPARALPVSGAFHSALMADASADFSKVLQACDLGPPSARIYSNVTAEPYPDDTESLRSTLSRQLLSPVRFCDLIERSHADGVRVYLEVGPRTVLSSLTRAILAGKPCEVLAMDASGGKGCGVADLARALSALAALGHRVDLTAWEAPIAEPRRPKMAVRLTGAPYRAPRPPKQQVDKPALPTPAQSAVAPAALREPERSASSTPSASDMNSMQQSNKTVSRPPADPASVPALLETVREGIRAIQEVQRQTAAAHEKFLEVQAEVQRSFQRIIESQQAVASGMAWVMPSAPVSAPPAPSAPGLPSVPAVASEPTARPSAQPPDSAPVVTTRSQARVDDFPVQAQAAPLRPDIEATLVSIVAELTGYPVEMLDASMDMEADLGIDSIKRVEIVAALQKRIPELPPLNTAQLGAMRTLRQVAEHIGGSLPATGARPAETSAAGPTRRNSDIEAELVGIVAELTGYPVEMLSPDMDLEADLGVDSIKRVEILATMQKRHPELRTASSAQYGALRTLRQVAERLAAELSPALPAESPAKDNPVEPAPPGQEVANVMLEIVAELTGYPRDTLTADMDMEADLGIDSIKRVEILAALQKRLPALQSVAASEVASLRTVAAIAGHLAAVSRTEPATANNCGRCDIGNASPPANRQGLSVLAKRQVVVAKEIMGEDTRGAGLPVADGSRLAVLGIDDLARATVDSLSRQGFDPVLLAPGDGLPAGDLAGLLIVAPGGEMSAAEATAFAAAAFRATRDAGARLRAAGKYGGALLATVTQFDGRFGLSGRLSASPLLGSLAGLAKTVALEWPEVRCRALDLDPAHGNAADRAAVLLDELSHADALEVGRSGQRRFAPTLQDAPAANHTPALSADDVVIVSGGARGITAECAFALARTTGAIVVLLGRSPAPSAESDRYPDAADVQALRAAVTSRLKTAGNGPIKPAQVEAEVRRVVASREVAFTLARFRDHGLGVEYHEVDVRDPDSVRDVMRTVMARHGRITGLVHGAGVIEDRLILDKTDDMFDRVFATKVAGLVNLLEALEHQPLKVIVLFGSVSGRFGRQGQSDYAMANEALNKMAISAQLRRPSCRTVSINWGPWEGGMVTPELKVAFERIGAPPMPLEAGCAAFLSELAVPPPGPAEVVIGSELPVPSVAPQPKVPAVKRPAVAQNTMSVVFERNLSAKRHAFLDSHIVGGNHVLPVAIILEWLGHAALHEHPGLRLAALRDLRIFKGVLLNGGTHDLFFLASRPTRSGGMLTVEVELRGAPNGNGDLLHARATAVVAEMLPEPDAIGAPAALQPYPHSMESIYSDILFHGSHFQAIERVAGHSPAGLTAILRCAPPPGEWMLDPPRSEWLADPLVTDGCMQLGALWCHQHLGAVSLPTGGQEYVQYRAAYPKPPSLVTAALRVQETTNHQLVADIDILDTTGTLIARFKRFEWAADRSLREAFRARTLAGAQM
jgi:malonyl CoA-acyl carrier protein transacylase/NAD(P)-dependent dehydrogenase (short-subunit alcohol dehydrogenase family)/acyl carrier protein